MSEILYTLRNAPKCVKISNVELKIGRKLNTVKDIIVTKPQPNYNVSELDDNLLLAMSVRERARGSKLEDVYTRKKGRKT